MGFWGVGASIIIPATNNTHDYFTMALIRKTGSSLSTCMNITVSNYIFNFISPKGSKHKNKHNG